LLLLLLLNVLLLLRDLGDLVADLLRLFLLLFFQLPRCETTVNSQLIIFIDVISTNQRTNQSNPIQSTTHTYTFLSSAFCSAAEISLVRISSNRPSSSI
jgi:hypothetical protein